MDDEVGHALAGRELDAGLEVLPAGVDAAVGDEADQVQAPARRFAARAQAARSASFSKKLPSATRVVDPGQVLLDDRAGAEVEVADLGVAHLPVGQADVAARGRQLRVRVALPERVEGRRLGERDRVARPGLGEAPAVEDDEREGATGSALGPSGRLMLALRRRSTRGGDDRGEVGGIEAGAADEGAVDLAAAEQLGRVAGLDRAAVEDPDRRSAASSLRELTRARTKPQASSACSGVAVRPVPIAQIGS